MDLKKKMIRKVWVSYLSGGRRACDEGSLSCYQSQILLTSYDHMTTGHWVVTLVAIDSR